MLEYIEPEFHSVYDEGFNSVKSADWEELLANNPYRYDEEYHKWHNYNTGVMDGYKEYLTKSGEPV